MWLADGWRDYELIDTGGGNKLERWGKVILLRPEPQAIWPEVRSHQAWNQINAVYHRSEKGGGQWEYKKPIPERWMVQYRQLRFQIKPMGFKHTGLFPEQSVNWDWMMELIGARQDTPQVLNLFAYTGGATVACAAAGASVTHVDAAKGMVQWAGENMAASGLADKPVRYIVDDCLKFVQREGRRGKRYDAIIMDPPSYGRGPNGEMWKLEDKLYELVDACMAILSDDPLFFLLNSYTTGLGASVIRNVLKLTVEKKFGGNTDAQEIGLPITASGLVLPCGVSGRWSR